AVEATAAINIGARLIAFADGGRITRIEDAGAAIANSVGLDLAIGDELGVDERHVIAQRMVEVLLQFLGFEPMDALAESLLLTSLPAGRFPSDNEPYAIMCSGGVAEFVYRRSAV